MTQSEMSMQAYRANKRIQELRETYRYLMENDEEYIRAVQERNEAYASFREAKK